MAVGLINSAKCCINTQIALDSLCHMPGGKKETSGMLAALLSPNNRAGFTQVTDAVRNAKSRPVNGGNQVEIEIEKPNCGVAAETKPSLCDVGTATVSPYLYLQPCVEQVASYSFRITKDEFANICESPNERLATTLRRGAEIVQNHINRKLADLGYGLMGNYASGDLSTGATAQFLAVINPNGSINASAFAKLKAEFRKQKCNTAPIVVGGDTLAIIEDIRQLGGTGPVGGTAGADASAMSRIAQTYYDSQIDASIQALAGDTASHVLSWSPGALQFLEWYENVDYREEFKEDYSETTITIDGITYDYSLHYSKCDKAWDVHISKCYDLFCIPDTAYAPCYEFNNKVHYTIGCGETDCTSFAC